MARHREKHHTVRISDFVFKMKHIGRNLRQATTTGQNQLTLITQLYWNQVSNWVLVQNIHRGMALHTSSINFLEMFQQVVRLYAVAHLSFSRIDAAW